MLPRLLRPSPTGPIDDTEEHSRVGSPSRNMDIGPLRRVEFLGTGGLIVSLRIQVDEEKISEFCRRHHIRSLSFFGSVLRDDFGPDSDIDVLVEFEPGHVPGLEFISIQKELSQIPGNRPVDLITPRFLNHRIRDDVLSSSELQHAQE